MATTPIACSWRSMRSAAAAGGATRRRSEADRGNVLITVLTVNEISGIDRHEHAIGVVAIIPTFQDRGTKIGALASESVTTPVTFLI